MPLPFTKTPDYTPPGTQKSLADTLLDAWRRGQNLVNHFWQTWKAEYLAALREKQRATLNRKDPTTVQFRRVGDVVQICDSTSRGYWRLGRITRLHESRDKAIRSSDILLANKRTVQRPLNALYPLEATSSGTQRSSFQSRVSTSQFSGSRASPFGKNCGPSGARGLGCVYLTFKLFLFSFCDCMRTFSVSLSLSFSLSLPIFLIFL